MSNQYRNKLLNEAFSKSVPVKNLVALCGERRRGKDYLTEALIRKHGATRLSFSDELRRLAQVIYPWFDSFGCDKEKPYVHANNTNNLKGRDILLNVGLVRNVDSAYFVRSFIHTQFMEVLSNPDRLFVITDFRTPDEYERFLKPLNIPIYKIIADVDESVYPAQEFEKYIREFEAYDQLYLNPMQGTDEFVEHFQVFAGRFNIKGLRA